MGETTAIGETAMTDTDTRRRSRQPEGEQPFERHPALASWIERLGNTGAGLSLGEWMIFVGALNHAIKTGADRIEALEAALRAIESIPRHSREGALEIIEAMQGRAQAALSSLTLPVEEG
jgi:hypothetical protein